MTYARWILAAFAVLAVAAQAVPQATANVTLDRDYRLGAG
jgi:hypothetical protein